MRKRTLAIFLATILILVTFPASALKYTYPAPMVDGGRAAENMPEEFTPENAAGFSFLAKESFDNNQTSSVFNPVTAVDGSKISFADNAVKLVKNDTSKALSFVMRYEGEIVIGGYYLFRCKIKTEDIQGKAPRNILQANGIDENGKTTYLKEEGGYGKLGSVSGTNDWYVMTQLLQIPEGTTKLSLYAYLPQKLTGTAWFDEFELYHIALDPMEIVLKKPNYKGLIYGDGDADINLDVLLEEREGFFDYQNMELCVRLVDEADNVYRYAEAKTVSRKMNFVFSSRGLSPKDYYLQTLLYNKNTGELISEKEHTIRKRAADYRPEVYLDENGRIIDDKGKSLLKGIYNSGGDYVKVAEAAKESGIKTIFHYGLWWATADGEIETHTAGKAYMRENDIGASINLYDFCFGERKTAEAKQLIQSREDMLPFFYQVANDYKDDKILSGYYLFDEPNPYMEGEELRWANEIMAQADINHPTYGVADRFWDKYGIYTKMSDVLFVDPYPVKGEDSDDLSIVGKSVRQAKENYPKRPVCVVLQGFRWVDRDDVRSPDRQELLNMAWQALCEGSEGISWYSYSAMKANSELEDNDKTMEQWLDDLNDVYSDVLQYESAILSDEPTPRYSVDGGGDWLNITLRRYNGKTYLFAVNNTKQQKSATVNIEGASVQSLEFSPLEVIVTEFDQADYMSTEAQLRGAGFSNGNMIFPVAEGEENILYVPKDAGVINYCMDISDNATLYIGKKQMPLKGKITMRLAKHFTVRVVSEDGKTVTEEKYRVVKE